MKPFYEKYREELNSPQSVNARKKGYPSHFHSSVEVFILLDGEYQIKINGILYDMKGGDVALISSYDVHEYVGSITENTKDLVILIPFSFAESFISRHKGERISRPILNGVELSKTLLSLANNYVNCKNFSEDIKRKATELFLTLIEEKCNFVKDEGKGEILLVKNMLFYIHNNYTSKIRVSDIAKDVGYSNEHVSRVFNKYIGQKIPEYVNNLRLDFIKKEIKKDRNKKITSLIFEAGFNSVQSYYRNKNK